MNRLFSALSFVMLMGWIGPAISDQGPEADQFKTKTLAFAMKYGIKTYLTNSDFQQLKKKKMEEINRKTDRQFEDDYRNAWSFLNQCPAIVSQYRLRPTMVKKDILKIVKGLTLNNCLAAVDNIPDQVILDHFDKCLNNPEIKDKSLIEQINLMMSKCLAGNGG